MSDYKLHTIPEQMRHHTEEPGVEYETPADVLRSLSAHLTALDVDVKSARALAARYRAITQHETHRTKARTASSEIH
ncbi:hypothetical protein [Burkholderia cenocepacia]|uniref:hypothetical protein n=1 Tax=Burkholderia cenocepacia TaxID=95486 RepID=UPI00286313EC|nr:hypothetical protein [Burkholderia cenocepacia]MDR8054229.1 hypothetical protein [Burkholderia cenocepacia]MDR8064672.1 hypothetical protein [Burkholderia cenocepacia]